MSALLQLHLHSGLLTPGSSKFGKDNCKTRWETYKFLDLMPLIPEVWRWVHKWFYGHVLWNWYVCIKYSCLTFYASAFRRRRHYVFGLSVRPSVRPSEAWNTLFWPVHRSVGPPDQLLPFYGMSVRPSVPPSVCPSVRLSVRPSVRRGFRAFAGDCMKGLAWNFTCWCILTIFRTDKFMVTVWWFF